LTKRKDKKPLKASRLLKVFYALGIAVENPQRGTSEDLQRKARPLW